MFIRISALLLLLVNASSAQQVPNLRVQSNVVIVPALVKDAEGHIVYGLTQSDFEIEDDGLEQGAEMSGGEYELFTTRKGFEDRMVDFYNHLHSRYLLSFAPKEPHPGLHQIQVRLKKSLLGTTLLSRGSYWATGMSQ